MIRMMVFLMFVSSILLLAVPSSRGLSFYDDFEDGNMDEWIDYGCPWRIENGELIMLQAGFPCGFTIGETNWQDYALGAKVKITEHQVNPERGEGVVIILRVRMPRYYVFSLRTPSGSGIKEAGVFYTDDGFTLTPLQVKPFEWELNRWYDLRVHANGNQFECSIDGEPVLSFASDLYPTGSVGLGIGNVFTSAHFDDFFVTDETPLSATAVSPRDRLPTTWGRLRQERGRP